MDLSIARRRSQILPDGRTPLFESTVKRVDRWHNERTKEGKEKGSFFKREIMTRVAMLTTVPAAAAFGLLYHVTALLTKTFVLTPLAAIITAAKKRGRGAPLLLGRQGGLEGRNLLGHLIKTGVFALKTIASPFLSIAGAIHPNAYLWTSLKLKAGKSPYFVESSIKRDEAKAGQASSPKLIGQRGLSLPQTEVEKEVKNETFKAAPAPAPKPPPPLPLLEQLKGKGPRLKLPPKKKRASVVSNRPPAKFVDIQTVVEQRKKVLKKREGSIANKIEAMQQQRQQERREEIKRAEGQNSFLIAIRRAAAKNGATHAAAEEETDCDTIVEEAVTIEEVTAPAVSSPPPEATVPVVEVQRRKLPVPPAKKVVRGKEKGNLLVQLLERQKKMYSNPELMTQNHAKLEGKRAESNIFSRNPEKVNTMIERSRQSNAANRVVVDQPGDCADASEWEEE